MQNLASDATASQAIDCPAGDGHGIHGTRLPRLLESRRTALNTRQTSARLGSRTEACRSREMGLNRNEDRTRSRFASTRFAQLHTMAETEVVPKSWTRDRRKDQTTPAD